jgi:hypothetical protein
MRHASIGLMVSLLASSAFAQTDVSIAARAKTIERLQLAGMNAATMPLCEAAGYVTNPDGRDDYMREEAELAMVDGFAEDQAYSYFTSGLKGQNSRDVSTLSRATQLARAGDKPGAASVLRPFVDEIVDRCDLLAGRSETQRFFTLTPLNGVVARRTALKHYGIADKTK